MMKNMIVLLIILSAFMTCGYMQCIEGVKILTRRKISDNAYTLQYQCMCPIDFMGQRCRYHRQIKCYLKPQSMNPTSINQNNFRQSMNISLQASMDCYIPNQFWQFVPLSQFLIERRLKNSGLDYDLEYGLDSGEVIWANTTQIFDDKGMVITLNGTKQDEDKLMYGNGPYKFAYKSNFYGMPLSDSQFFSYPTIIRPSGNSISKINNEQKIQFLNVQQYQKYVNDTSLEDIQSFIKGYDFKDIFSNPEKAKELQKDIKDKRDSFKPPTQLTVLPMCKIIFNVNVRQAAEFQTIRIEFSVKEHYRMKIAVSYTSVNSPQFFIPVKVQGVGKPPVYDITFNRFELSRWFYFGMLMLLLLIVYLIYRFKSRHQKLKNTQIQQNIEQQQNDFTWQ